MLFDETCTRPVHEFNTFTLPVVHQLKHIDT